jgi:hypothetical protein
MIERNDFDAGDKDKYQGFVFDFRFIDFMNLFRF